MAEKPAFNNDRVVLQSPTQLPFHFTITVGEVAPEEHAGMRIGVTAEDPVTGNAKTCLYELPDRQHASYLNFFQALSADFGLRLPQNRQAPVWRHSDLSLRELLTENLVSGIRYGYGDPAVIRVEEKTTGEQTCYYLVTTSNDAPDSFPICRSTDLTNWEFVGFVFPHGQKPEWAADGEFISDYWAPEMHAIGNEFRVYFVARDKNSLELCIGMARSESPAGPFTPENEPILKGNNIDPHLFVENEGAFLYWKEDNNGVWPARLIDFLYTHPELTTSLFHDRQDLLTASFILTLCPWIKTLKAMEGFLVQQILIEAVTADFSGFEKMLDALAANQPGTIRTGIHSILACMKTPVYAQQLSADGQHLTGERKKIIENDLPWEAHLVEGMWVTKNLERYYLFYSGNDFSTDQYGVGVAVADHPLGPFTKVPKQILTSTEKWWAPGHPSVVIGPDGNYQLILHGYFPGKAGYKEFRALLTIPIAFENGVVQLLDTYPA